MNVIIPKNIIIVDDDPMLSATLSDFLEDQGHTVHAYGTGEECLKHIAVDAPHVVILDYYLNSVNPSAATGLEVLKAIRAAYPAMHVIMLSSQERYDLSLQTIAKGAEKYVIKGKGSFDEIKRYIDHL
jgi:DNA-binding NarL/FixJ family response regulator